MFPTMDTSLHFRWGSSSVPAPSSELFARITFAQSS